MKIIINDLIVEAKHGVHQNEKLVAQRFNICVEVALISDKASKTDNLHDTVDWSNLRKQIIDTTVNNSFNLVEKLAGEIAVEILTDNSVNKVRVAIQKLDAFKSGTPEVVIELEK